MPRHLRVTKNTNWADYGTIVGDLDDYPEFTPVKDVIAEPVMDAEAPVFDLMGRRVTRLQPGTIYVQNGMKFILK